MHPWYVVQTQPQREGLAERWLDALCERVLCPRHRTRVNVHGYRREVTRPLFPGYLFASFDAATRFPAVHYAYGVHGIVRFGGELAAVPEELIVAIESRTRDGCVVLDPPRLGPGQRVEILEGPFRGHTGIFQREVSGAGRVAILLDTLRMSARAIVEREAVRALG